MLHKLIATGIYLGGLAAVIVWGSFRRHRRRLAIFKRR